MTTGTLKIDPNSTGVYTIAVGHGGGGGSGIVNNGSGITRPPPHLYPYDDTVLNHYIKDHEITGQTITVSSHIKHSDIDLASIAGKDVQDGIKRGLLKLLVEKLFESCMIEFTRQEQVTEDATFFRARIHVVPDTQVRIIRELKDARKTT